MDNKCVHCDKVAVAVKRNQFFVDDLNGTTQLVVDDYQVCADCAPPDVPKVPSGNWRLQKAG